MPRPAAVEAVHHRRELRLLRGCANWRFCLLLGGRHARQPGGRAADRADATDERARQVDRRRGGRRSTCCVLGVFKYYGVLRRRTSTTRCDAVGLGLPLPLLTIALPVGVSFFTFQAISYVVDVKRRLVEPASHDRRRGLPELLPAPGRRADRARARVPAAARSSRATRARVAVGSGHRADRARAGQEGRDRRLPRARRSSTRCSRVPQAYAGAGRAARRLRLHGADLLRLLRLHGHGDRARAADGLRVPAELPQPVPRDRLPRLLAALAHDAVALPARLPLHPARRQPQGQVRRPTAT